MGIEIPGAVRWLVPIVVGDDWPEGDETSLRRLGETWSEVGKTVDAIGHDGEDAIRAALAAITGDTDDALQEYWKKVGGDGAIGDLIQLCDQLGTACDNTALDIEHAKLSIIAALIALAAELAAMAAAAVATLGASSAGAVAAEVATQVTVRMILKELLMRVLEHALIDGLTELAIDGGIQGLQFAKGDRHKVDGGSLTKSFVTGGLDGAVSTGLGAEGLGRFVPGLGDGIGRTVAREAGIESLAGVGGSVASTLAGGGEVTWKTLTSGGIGGAVEGAKGGFESARPDVSGLSGSGADGHESSGTSTSTGASAHSGPNSLGDNGTSGSVTSAAAGGAGGRPDAMPNIESGDADSSTHPSVEATPDPRSATAGGSLDEAGSHSILSEQDANSSPLPHDSDSPPATGARQSSLDLDPNSAPQPSGLGEPSSPAANVEAPTPVAPQVDSPTPHESPGAAVSEPAVHMDAPVADVTPGQTHASSVEAPVEAPANHASPAATAAPSVPSAGAAPAPAMASGPQAPAPVMTGPPAAAASPWTPPISAPPAPIAPLTSSAPMTPVVPTPVGPVAPIAPVAPVTPPPAMTGQPPVAPPAPIVGTPPPPAPVAPPAPAPVSPPPSPTMPPPGNPGAQHAGQPAPVVVTPGPAGADGHSILMTGAPLAAVAAGGAHHRIGQAFDLRQGYSGAGYDAAPNSTHDGGSGHDVLTEDGESHSVTWSREQLAAMPSAHDVIAHELAQRGVLPEEFQRLLSQPVETLTVGEQQFLHEVRIAVPLPDSDAVLQKVVTMRVADALLNNAVSSPYEPSAVAGSVTVAIDTAELGSSGEIIEGLQLDYEDSAFAADQPVVAIRFVRGGGSVEIPNGVLTHLLGLDPTLDLRQPHPYTGTGNTASEQYSIPEYALDGGRMLPDAEMWQIEPDGTERLVGVLGMDMLWHRVNDHG